MAEDWAAAAADVDAGMREAGALVALHQPGSDGAYDTLTDTTSGATPPQTHEAFGVVENYSTFSIAQGVVAAADRKLLLSPLKADGTAMPEPVADSWTASIGGEEWEIKNVKPLSPAGTAVLFELQLRGA